MAILDTDINFRKSGGTTNENQHISLGGAISTTLPGGNFQNNFLHNVFDEVSNTEAVSGDVEYRHCYIRNLKTFTLRNCKLITLKTADGPWSKVEFARGTANNNIIEQTVANENSPPVGISESDWFIPTSANPMLLGELQTQHTASFWMRRTVLPGALIKDNETVSIRVFGDPPSTPSNPPGTGQCPSGQHFDPDTQTCVPDATPCPEGTTLQNGVCVPTSCPEGQILQNGVCVPIGSPPPHQQVVVAAVGDIGCSSNAERVLGGVAALAEGIEDDNGNLVTMDLFIANGDLSYSSGASCFLDRLEGLNIRDITKITIGNHDDSEDGSSSLRQAFLSAFNVPSGGYYSFDIQHIHFLLMDTQQSYSTSSAQYRFVAGDPNGSTQAARDGDLKTAFQNSATSWIVVAYHKPSLTAESNHGPLTDFRNIYHPLFDQYKVDIVIQSHNHNMQRSWPIKHNASSPASPTVMSTASNHEFTNVDGRIFIVTGAGGRSHYGIDNNPNYIAFQNDSDYGFLYLHWNDTSNSVVGVFVAINGNQLEVIDTFAIGKT